MMINWKFGALGFYEEDNILILGNIMPILLPKTTKITMQVVPSHQYEYHFKDICTAIRQALRLSTSPVEESMKQVMQDHEKLWNSKPLNSKTLKL